MIPVTKTYMPPFAEYTKNLERIWDSSWLTNRGQLVIELEDRLKQHLQVSNILLTTNGTLPLQIALRLLGKGGEIITTPFSYVATTASIVWEHCTPVFVDIHPEYLTIDEKQIEAAITDKTTCILATHVFGNPCHVEEIERIAKLHNLMVIYDAAHCFNVRYKNKCIFDYGDISTTSFHATKLFHSAEGGAIFCKEESLQHQVYYSHNFGHNGPLDFHGLGINAKMSELQAAMGLTVLPHVEENMQRRSTIIRTYTNELDFTQLKTMQLREHTEWNSSYYPIIFSTEERLLETQLKLNSEDIFPRRYFYPSLNKIEYTKGSTMPVSEKIASTILCLPLYHSLEETQIDQIIKIINRAN